MHCSILEASYRFLIIQIGFGAKALFTRQELVHEMLNKVGLSSRFDIGLLLGVQDVLVLVPPPTFRF